jgi:hypothetical protein
MGGASSFTPQTRISDITVEGRLKTGYSRQDAKHVKATTRTACVIVSQEHETRTRFTNRPTRSLCALAEILRLSDSMNWGSEFGGRLRRHEDRDPYWHKDLLT